MDKVKKELLLKDLSARLPYGVKFQGEDSNVYTLDAANYFALQVQDVVFKPYLRPMSSMTEEEFELLKRYSGLEYDQLDLAEFPNNHKCLDFYLSEIPSYTVILVFDWLNAHHFDYRGLIPMGLALEATEGMYKND